MTLMTVLHIYFVIVILLLQFTISSLIKSVSLTPSNPHTDGATAFCSHEDCTITNNEWHITARDSIGFHLEIDLDSSWGFHPDHISIVSLTIHSTQAMEVSVDLDALVVFSVDNSQYITHWLSLDQKYSNTIYPTRSKFATCDTVDPQTALAHGDIKQCALETSCHESTDRGSKVTGGDNWGLIAPQNYPNNLNAWPMTIKVTNNPMTQQTLSTITSAAWNTWSQSCNYNESFHVEHGLQIYIATEDIGEIISFTQFDLDYQVVAALTEPTEDIVWYKDTKRTMVKLIPYLIIALSLCFVVLCIICIKYALCATKDRKEREKSMVEQHAHLPLSEAHVIPSNEEEEEQVKQWLKKMNLAQYYSTLIDNGYDSLQYLKLIKSKDDLQMIGIHNVAHQVEIMSHIKNIDIFEADEEEIISHAHVPNVIDINALTKYAHAAHRDANSESDTEGEEDFVTEGGEIMLSVKEDKKEENVANVTKYKRAQYLMTSGYNHTNKKNVQQYQEAYDAEELYTTSIGGSWMINPHIEMEDDDDINTLGFIS